MKVFSGSSNKPLAEKIARSLGAELSPIEIFVFPDEEKRIQIKAQVVDEDCVVVQTTSTPAAENYMELFFIVDGLKRSGAKNITVVMPYLGYQRQDHVFRSGEAVSLDVVVQAMEGAGVTKVITFDLHSIKIPEVFKVPVSHLSALPLFAEIIRRGPVELLSRPTSSHSLRALDGSPSPLATPALKKLDAVLVSPDMGGLRRIKKMSELLDDMPWVATVKDRDLDTGEIVIDKIEGDVELIKGSAFIVDDMIASGKTIVEAAKLLKKHGVTKVYAFAAHAVFSNDACELLQNSLVEKVFVTDSVFVPKEKRFAKLEILSISETVTKELQNNF
jgi:ribose-phosphate pyrophosphokinase